MEKKINEEGDGGPVGGGEPNVGVSGMDFYNPVLGSTPLKRKNLNSFRQFMSKKKKRKKAGKDELDHGSRKSDRHKETIRMRPHRERGGRPRGAIKE